MTGSYTEVQRRAANQILGADGHYDFEPMFLHESGHRTGI